MKAIVLDMYGVIVKQTGDDFVPYVQRTFPDLKPQEIYTPWFKADVGELTSLGVWETLGFKGDIEKIEKEYFDVISISGDLKIQKPDERIFQLTMEQLGYNAEDCLYVDDREGNLEVASKAGMNAVLFNSRNVQYEGNTVTDFIQLTNLLL